MARKVRLLSVMAGAFPIGKPEFNVKIDIGSARIATEIDQAYDTFYVTDRQGRRVEDPAAMGHLREALEEALLAPL